MREPLRHRDVSTDEVPETAEADNRADERVTGAERQAQRNQVTDVLDRAMARLSAEDQVIVRMRFVDGRTLADVARALKIEQKPLYRRVNRLRERLRAAMEADGVHDEDVQELIDRKGP
jgi:RNA polymerase sigma factor (sigma-70 family)